MKANFNQKQILKSISIFGGVHLTNMFLGIVRSKIAALWLGTQGVGVLGLLLSSFGLLSTVVQLGLPMSLIRYLSGTKELPQRIYISQVVLWITGFIGGLVVLVFSTELSKITFGNSQFTWPFRWLAFAIIFKQIAIGYATILQSQSAIAKYARANIIASCIGVLCTIPLYYFYKIEGIAYNILVLGIVECIVFYIYFKKLKVVKVSVTKTEVSLESKKLLKQSSSFAISSFITLFAIYLVQLFVSKNTNLTHLGYYIAGFAILNTYVSIVFTIMGMDYFPRLTKIKDDVSAVNTEVNHQFFIGMLLLMPILVFLLLAAPWVIKILYSDEFLPTLLYVYFASIGVLFKLFSWTVGFVIITKGSNKLILFNAIIYNSLFVVLHILGFYLNGLKGIAIASSIYYLCHLLGNYFISYKRFGTRMQSRNIKLFSLFVIVLAFSVFVSTFVEIAHFRYSILSVVFLCVTYFSIKNLYKILIWKE